MASSRTSIRRTSMVLLAPIGNKRPFLVNGPSHIGQLYARFAITQAGKRAALDPPVEKAQRVAGPLPTDVRRIDMAKEPAGLPGTVRPVQVPRMAPVAGRNETRRTGRPWGIPIAGMGDDAG